MIDTDNYEDAKKMVEDAGLIDDNDGWLDVHYRKIAHLLAEVKRLREELDETEYRLEMAEDVLGRSDWNTIYREIIDEDGGEE
jgi:hypothetical protein